MPNQHDLTRAVSRWSHTLLRPDELPQVLARAFAIFASERPGPVHIAIPLDVMKMAADSLDVSAWPLPTPPAASADAVHTAAQWLRDAKRPLIAIGGGAINAAALLATFAETLDAPVINTVNAKGVMPASHSLSVGGSPSNDAVRELLRDADVVLALGTELGETDYDYFYRHDLQADIQHGRLIRVDIDAAQLLRNVKPALAVRSDATQFVMALQRELGLYQAQKNGATRAMVTRDAQKINSPYAAFFSALTTALPNAIIVGDSTQATYYAWLHFEATAPRRYFHSCSGFGTLGFAIPAAIGAQLALPNTPVMALIGDGGAQFSIAELASAVEARLPVIFLIWNNAGYREIRQSMNDTGVSPIGVDIYTPNFQLIAQGFGCEASRARDGVELQSQLRAAVGRQGPTVIEIIESDFLGG
jgi:acetolactate synthase-1/2/3 large subunit